MRLQRLAPIVLALAGCAVRPPAATPSAGAPAGGLFELPGALRVDPSTLHVPELRFEPPEPRIERLPNGVLVYLLEDRTAPLVQVRAMVELGTLDEPASKIGLASVAWAALRTGGAGKLGAAQVDETLEDMAALLEGDVSEERAELVLEVRSADFDRGLSLFWDVLRHPRFEEGAVAHVLDRAKDAVERRKNEAGVVAQEAFMEAIWGKDSPFAQRPTIETLGRIRRDDVVRLHAAAVMPQTTRILITGDFDANAARSRIRALAGDWKAGSRRARVLPGVPTPGPRQVLVVPTEGAQAKVRLGHLGLPRHDPRDFAVRLLDSVLGNGPGSSRLYTEIRDRRGLAYSVESTIAPGPVRGLVLVAADTKPENAREVIARCIEGMEAVRGTAPPTDDEVAVARDSFVNAFAFQFDTAARAAHQRALHDAQGYPADYFKTFRERLSAVTPAEVAAAARDVLRPDRLQIVVVGDPRRMGDLSQFGPVRMVLGDDSWPTP